MRYIKTSIRVVILFWVVLFLIPSVVWAQLPPFPAIFNGTVSLGGKVPPIGSTIYAEVGTYRSNTATLGENGRFVGLAVGPLEADSVGKPIYFYYQGVKADQTPLFTGTPSSTGVYEVNLTFPALPSAGDEGVVNAFSIMAALGLTTLLAGSILLLRARRTQRA